MAYQNSILLDLLNGEQVERPPIWIMRQAGRILPGYRKIRAAAGSFKKLVTSPDLIAEVTTEPLDVLGVDAAILFSDILVIPEAMGLDYSIVETVGPRFEETVKSESDIKKLISGSDVLDQLEYVFNSIDKTKARLNGSNPLIGFAGAPWTLFAYMIEGGGSKTFSKARKFLYEHPKASHQLLEKLTTSIVAYLNEKIRRGVDVIQLFDSWAEMLPLHQYEEFSLRYVKQIFDEVEGAPKIFFPKGAWYAMPAMKNIAMDAISIDWKTSSDYVRNSLNREIIVQGNMDPCQLYASPEVIKDRVNEISKSIGGKHIFNLGHGVYPDTPTDHVVEFVKSVKEIKY